MHKYMMYFNSSVNLSLFLYLKVMLFYKDPVVWIKLDLWSGTWPSVCC